jgi:hypothetical protein
LRKGVILSYILTHLRDSTGKYSLTAMDNIRCHEISWDITSCRPLKVNGCFGGTSRLHTPAQAGELLGFQQTPEDRTPHYSLTCASPAAVCI